MALKPIPRAWICVAGAALLVHPAPPPPSAAAIAAAASRPAGAPPRHLLFAADQDGWVADTVLLARKLAFAKGLGYDGLVCSLTPPASGPGAAPAWTRGPETDCRWRFAGPSGPGGMGARRAFLEKARTVKRIAERSGFAFIPMIGDMGWGFRYAAIDPGTLAGEYMEIRVPDTPENLFGAAAGRGIVTREAGWGDRAGKAVYETGRGDNGTVTISLGRAGLFAAHWRIDAPWDGYLRCRFPLRARSGAGDSAMLKAYAYYPGRPHVRAFRLLASARARPGAGQAAIECAFYVKRGRTYYLDLEYRCARPGGGALEAGPGGLARSAPPRADLIDTRGYEASPGPGRPSCLEYLAAHGSPEEAGMRTLISSRSPALADAPWFDLSGSRADSAWASLTAVRGAFRDGSPEAAMRWPIDPLAPASRQITAEILDALAEAMGPGTGYLHLGGDEVFSLGRSRRQAGLARAGSGPAGIYARILRDRMAQADSAFARRFPGRPLPTYLIYGDMLSRLYGIEEGTLPALDTLAGFGELRGRIILMPWYYASHVSSPPFPLPASPRGEAPEALLLRTFREDCARFEKAGFDFLGLYATEENLAGLKDQILGADAWGKVCAERAAAAKGRCLGLGFAAWETHPGGAWGRNYNGMLLLARTWGGSPALARDADGDGMLDSLKGSGTLPR